MEWMKTKRLCDDSSLCEYHERKHYPVTSTVSSSISKKSFIQPHRLKGLFRLLLMACRQGFVWGNSQINGRSVVGWILCKGKSWRLLFWGHVAGWRFQFRKFCYQVPSWWKGVQMWGHVERAHANSLKEAAKKKEFYSDIKTKYKDKFLTAKC